MFEQEKSVVQLGKNGLAIFLPTIWTRKNGIEKGDRILVQIEESELTIRPKQRAKKH